MRVYYAGNPHADHTALVAPGADPRAVAAGVVSEWLTESGEPRQITVTFRKGAAEVSDPLGKYLCAIGIAKRTRLIVPRKAA